MEYSDLFEYHSKKNLCIKRIKNQLNHIKLIMSTVTTFVEYFILAYKKNIRNFQQIE